MFKGFLLIICISVSYSLAAQDVNVLKKYFELKNSVPRSHLVKEFLYYLSDNSYSDVRLNSILQASIEDVSSPCDKVLLRTTSLLAFIERSNIYYVKTYYRKLEDEDISKLCSDSETIYDVELAKASYFLTLGEYKSAEFLLITLVQKTSLSEYPNQIAGAYYNLSILERLKGDLGAAENYLNKAIDCADKKNNYNSISYYVGLANIHTSKMDASKARKLLALSEELSPSPYHKTYINLEYGRSFLGDGDTTKALTYFLASDSLARSQHNVRVSQWLLTSIEKITSKNPAYQEMYVNYVKSGFKDIEGLINKIEADSVAFLQEDQVKRSSIAKSTDNRVLYIIILSIGVVFAIFLFFKMKGKRKEEHEISGKEIAKPEQRELIEVDEQLIQKFERLLDKEELYKKSNLTVRMVAKRMKVDQRSLSSFINAHYEDGFRAVINMKRIELAKKMLKSCEFENYSLDGIASSVGYRNMSSFYTNFKKYTGVTPTEFKELSVNEKDATSENSNED